jgi:hypothetical protein
MGRKKRNAGRSLHRNDHGKDCRETGAGKYSKGERGNGDQYGQTLFGQSDIIAGHEVKVPEKPKPEAVTA